MDAIEVGGNHALELFTLELRGSINVIHQTFHIELGKGVGRKDFLETLTAGGKAERGLGV